MKSYLIVLIVTMACWPPTVHCSFYSFTGRVGSSGTNTKVIKPKFRLSHNGEVPTVVAWAKGETRYSDTFEVVVSDVTTSGFTAAVTRTDSTGGWGQSLDLTWTETSSNVPQSAGEIYQTVIGNSRGPKEVHAKLRRPYINPPNVVAWCIGHGRWSDTFEVKVSNVTNESFIATVIRTDTYKQRGGWGQNPILYWTETSNECSDQHPVFYTNGEDSSSNTKTMSVQLRLVHFKPPIVRVWADGEARHCDVFSAKAFNVGLTSFEVSITRSDASWLAWDQDVQVYWTETDPDSLSTTGCGEPLLLGSDQKGPRGYRRLDLSAVQSLSYYDDIYSRLKKFMWDEYVFFLSQEERPKFVCASRKLKDGHHYKIYYEIDYDYPLQCQVYWHQPYQRDYSEPIFTCGRPTIKVTRCLTTKHIDDE